jgi:hypothetical protein
MMLPAFLRWEAVGLSVFTGSWRLLSEGTSQSRAAASAISFATSSLRSAGISVRSAFPDFPHARVDGRLVCFQRCRLQPYLLVLWNPLPELLWALTLPAVGSVRRLSS